MNAVNRRHILAALAVLAILSLVATPLLAQPVMGTIGVNDQRQLGTHPSGEIFLYSPDPVQSGSSLSHWDPVAFPNLLMEPAINDDLPFLGLDVTPGLLEDEGWPLGTSNINIVPLDDAGVGFTDPRPFAGAPGNPATTLGEARVNLFNAVLGAWANTLESPVDIDVLVTWTSLTCVAGQGAVLAAAGTTFIFRDGDLPRPGTWYHAALAEALAGEDLTGSPAEGGGDIIVFMNADIDEGCLGAGTGYYYGLDGNDPSNQIDVAPVVLHEIGHGLGMANFTNEGSGALFMDTPGIFDVFTYDHVLGKTWAEMTDAERQRSAINFRQVTWNGANANAQADAALDFGVPELAIASPPAVAGSYEIGGAAFGGAIPEAGLSGQIACMKDGLSADGTTDVSIFNGCGPATNPGEIAGKIALIDRGACGFTTKVKNAQDAGAIGAIIVNNAGNTAIGLGGSDPSVTIPAVGLGRRDGNRIREAACPGAAVILDGERFQVSARFRTADGQEGEARGQHLTDDTGWFYFFSPDNVELVVKVLNACDLEGFNSYWVFAAGLTDVDVTITVQDTQRGLINVYNSPLGTAFQPITDTSAFETCP